MKKLVLIIVCVPVPPPVVIEPGGNSILEYMGRPTGIGRVGTSAAINWKRGHYGHPEWRGPGRSYGPTHYGGHPGHERR